MINNSNYENRGFGCHATFVCTEEDIKKEAEKRSIAEPLTKRDKAFLTFKIIERRKQNG
jgi:hypothetical protein